MTLVASELCPPDAVCIDIPGAVDISTWAAQLERMYVALKGCKYVQFELPFKPVTESLADWEDAEVAKIGQGR